jgi:hypothetical protein
MDTDVLLLRLDHPDSLFSHLEDDAEDVHHVGLPDALHMQRGIINESTELLQDITQRKKFFKIQVFDYHNKIKIYVNFYLFESVLGIRDILVRIRTSD